MRTFFTVAVLVTTASLAACAAPTQREFGPADVDAIRQLSQDFAAAYNAKDAETTVSFFSGGAGVMPPNASTVRGTETIRGYFVSRFDAGATALTIDAKDISGSGPLAYAEGEYSLMLTPPDGRQSKDRGKFLWVLRDFNGRWLLDYVIFSSDFPPAPPPEPAEPN